jgi:regulator of PEP synthase PpsR (kinase-PPPase family)
MGQLRVHTILVISDATGSTAQRVTEAALLQFPGADPVIERRPEVRTRAQVRAAVQEAQSRGAMVVHTLVSSELRRYLFMEANSYGIIAVDLMGGILTEMGRYLEASPQVNPGLLYGDEGYFRRVDALDYAIRHDDGKRAGDLGQADVVLLGISRTSKTPLSIFLAYRGYYVANVPVILHMALPKGLEEVFPGRCVGLVVNAQSLVAIREARVKQYAELSLDYSNIDHIREELRYSRRLFAQQGWPVVDVSGKAVEETAREVLNLLVSD